MTRTGALAAILALTALAYLPALGNDFVNWDDDQYVYENTALRGPSPSLVRDFVETRGGRPVLPNVMGNYHPLTMLSLRLDHALAGRDPVKRPDRETDLRAGVFHATNVALHLVNTLLVFLLAEALASRRAAAVTALLFGVATLHVESVAWVSERKDVLYAAFFLAALLLYLRYTTTAARRFYGAALGAFVLAVLAKGQAVTLAPTLVAIDALKGRPLRGRVLAEKIPFFALALVFGLIAIHAQGEGGNVLVREAAQPWMRRPLFAAYGLVHYVAQLLVPWGLQAHHSYAQALARPFALYVLCPALALLLAAGTFVLGRRGRTLAFGPLFFAINVAPVLQLLPVGSAVMADRYSYVPSIGLFLLVALAFEAGRRRRAVPTRRHVDMALAVYAIVMAGLTARRAAVWHDSLTLWTEERAHDPASAIACNNLATYRYKTGDPRAALELADRAVALDPGWYRPYANRAVLRDVLGQPGLARADYDRTLELRPGQPVALNNRGKLKQEAGDLEGAREDFSAAIVLDPRPLFLVNRAEVGAALGRTAEARDDLTAALEREPARPDILGERAILRAQTGDAAGALEDFSAVVRLLPGSPYPYLNRARARVGAGDCAGAASDLETAARLGVALPEEARRELSGRCPVLSGGSSTGR
jgi:lipoprotein NlpI